MTERHGSQDDGALSSLGYTPELSRGMGAFSNFALSFSIISVLTGAITLYGYGLKWGGPWVMTIGWPLVAVLTLPIALSLGELASAFPTAGALYHWASLLGGRGLGWLTAWLNVVGQFAITAGIDWGLCELLAPALGLGSERGTMLALYAVVLTSHAVLNHVGVKLVAALNTVSAWYHVLGVVVLVGCVLALAPMQPVAFLTLARTEPGHPVWYGFLVALMQAGWTFTGYDASAHATEETVDAARSAPRGMVLAVASSAVAGWALLLAITWAIPSLDGAVASSNAFLYVLRNALGVVGELLVWLVLGAMWFCGLASITSNSRMLYAFARDGGLPASNALKQVSKRFASPHVAVWVSAAMAFVVALWAEAYSAMIALSTLALYVSYALPIGAGLWARRTGRWRVRGPWHLGRWSTVVNAIALVWVAVMGVLMLLPENHPAGLTLGGVLLVLGVAWLVSERRRFQGPPVSLETFQGGATSSAPASPRRAP